MSDNSETQIIQTDVGNVDGQTKCPKCGATDISLNIKDGKLRCNFCRHEFEPHKAEEMKSDIANLKGKIIGSASKDIEKNSKDMITLKCTSCGAEVVIDTNESTQARCHWCRNTLSINQQIPNGAVPDVVLPFKISKEDARRSIDKFVGDRKYFAHPKFKSEFTSNNIMGVYLPYMIVDINAHAEFSGEGEVQTRRYTVEHGDSKETRYDADVYNVERKFGIAIEGLTVESSKDKLEANKNKTNNIINSIMPFDIENSVKWDSNYLKGFHSEKRDLDISGVEDWVSLQGQDVARYKINADLKKYDRGLNWKNERFDIIGEQWKAAYLPVWLYSYQEKKGGRSVLHYVAVNARTKETMGSVPINTSKLVLTSILIEVVCLFLGVMIDSSLDSDFGVIVGLLSGIIFYFVMYSRYRNAGARHLHEAETKATLRDIVRKDEYVKERRGLSSSSISGQNNHKISTQQDAQKLASQKAQQKANAAAVAVATTAQTQSAFTKENIKYGNASPIYITDSKFGALTLNFRGTFSIKVVDNSKLSAKPLDQQFDAESGEMTHLVRSAVVGELSSYYVDKIANNYDNLIKVQNDKDLSQCISKVNEMILKNGIELTDLNLNH